MNKVCAALLFFPFLLSPLRAEEPVQFADPKLKAAVERDLWLTDPTPTDMLGLTELVCIGDWGKEDEGISDLEGLEYATNLQTLNLRLNQVGDLSPLAGLTSLETLNLSQNHVSDLSPLSGLTGLRDLNLHENHIGDLSDLAGLVNVEVLILRFNTISDISALSGMTGLRELDLGGNKVTDLSPLSSLPWLSSLCLWNNGLSDLSPLAGVTSLDTLDADMNFISDLAPLAGLPNLRDLDLESNRISDIEPLCGLTSLMYLNLQNNPLPQSAYDVLIPQIIANNPRISIAHDSHAGRWLTLSSTVGGAVIQPGEGRFVYDGDVPVRLEAEAEPGYVFGGWSGTYVGAQDSAFITMNQDHQIQATFLSLRDTLYVDGAALDDPRPEDPAGSDPNEDGTPEHPFDNIQEALDVAMEGATIFVAGGTYRENISFPRRTVRLIGMDPNDPSRSCWPVIEGVRNEPVVRFDYSPRSKSLLRGFVLTHGRGHPAGAIHCNDASPTITHCLIVGNRSTDPNGATVYCRDSKAVLTNCTIADNYAGPNGAGLTTIESAVTVLDSIFWDNLPEEIRVDEESVPDIRYCAVRGWWPDYGNIHKNPLFARAGSRVNPDNPQEVLGSADPRAVWVEGDYHLKSLTGRWDPYQQTWVQDDVHSPAIDAGLKTNPVGQEPVPNGGRVNMGVYGGTPEASKSKL